MARHTAWICSTAAKPHGDRMFSACTRTPCGTAIGDGTARGPSGGPRFPFD
jgi:hypothetical protein